MISGVLGLVPFTSAPSLPYILYGHVDWQSQALGGVRIELTNQNTGYSTVITTNIDGYWQEEGSNWLTTSKSRPPVQFRDTIKIKTLDGCGTNDVCEKTFSAKDGAFENFAQIDLSISGVLVVTSPPSGGGGGSSGGGGGGGGGSIPAWICEEWSTCDNGQQTRICKQGQLTRKEKQNCVISEPIPITVPEPKPPIEPETPTIAPETPIEPKTYVCMDGTIVFDLNECLETKEQVEKYIKSKTGYYVGGSIIGIGFIALVIYWIKRNRARAKKMIDTRIENIKKK